MESFPIHCVFRVAIAQTDRTKPGIFGNTKIMAPLPRTSLKTEDIISYDEMAATQPAIEKRELKIVWRNVFVFALLHVAAVYGFYLFCFTAMWLTFFYTILMAHIGALGITAGAHRLWTHRSYKARLPLQIMLLYFNTMALQNCVIDWARDHRMHHKYSDTNADPHNATRGFFFAHIGWLLVKKHPEIKAKGHTIDMTDLLENPLLRFQKRYYKILAITACFVIPTYISTLWSESLWNSFFVCAISRYTYSLNVTWLVNSAAHLWEQDKPYDKHIMPGETKIVSLLTLGEGYHNYHHTFPSDYRTAELGYCVYINLTTTFIDLMAKLGWAYDMRRVSPDVIQKRAKRTGDGSHQAQH